ncbi:carbamoyltransferase C-terminal domain-containing protein [Streptomyces sp. NPDC040724]|uniref:carbamoyltransferase family protein n=1 Tax=Streptomyces sp. NPDC040724 TaxID=3155612 RepID=UPI0033E6A758
MTGKPWVLGVSASHNGGACLLHGDEIVVAVQEERLSGTKRDRIAGSRPSLAIDYCLRHAGITPRELDLVVLCAQGPAGSTENDITLNPQLQVVANGVRWTHISHHLGHALSAYAVSGFKEAVVLVVDGVGSPVEDLSAAERAAVVGPLDGWEIVSVYEMSGTSVAPVEKQLVPDGRWLLRDGIGMLDFGSIGGMYSAVAQQVFGHALDAGKVMGLAPFGRAKFAPEDFLSVDGPTVKFSRTVPRAFSHDDRWPQRREEYADLAASVQAALETAICGIVGRIRTRSRSRNLCYAGGVALNCVVNERLWRESGFEDVFVPPFAEDSGPAVGAAYHGLWELTRTHTAVRLRADGLGRPYSQEETDRAALSVPGVRVRARSAETTLDMAADRLSKGDVGGWFQGRSEFGPRALGHRSILADPRRAGIKERLNAEIKRREEFRPFAPSVIAENVGDWFHVLEEQTDSPFILRTWPFRDAAAERVPAVSHVDGSARVQTVHAAREPRFHGLIRRFETHTSIPMLLNTSFNGPGQPIVETPEDAVWTMLELGLDFLVLEDLLIEPDPELLRGPTPAFRSVLGLVPVMAATGYNLAVPLPDGRMVAAPDQRSTLSFRVPTPSGIRTQSVPLEAMQLLALVDGESTGGDLHRRLNETRRNPVDADSTARTLWGLRRTGVIGLRAEV